MRRSRKVRLFLRNYRRSLAILAALLSVIGLAFTAVPARAATSAPSLALSRLVAQATGAVSTASITPPSGNVTFDIDPGIGLDTTLLRQLVTQVQGESSSLSDGFKRAFEGYSEASAGIAQAPEFTTGTDWPDFDGTLNVDSDGTGVSVTIPVAEAQAESATAWQQIVALAVGGAVLLVVRAACVGAMVAIGGPIGIVGKTVCAAIGNFLGVFVRGWILQAYENTLGDAGQWALTIGESLLAAVGPTLWEAGIGKWAENTLPGYLISFYNWVKNTFIPAAVWLGSKIISGIKAAATFIYNVASGLPSAVRGLSVPSSPGGASCDIYAFYGTPCAAAYSTTRALYSGYNGPLYQVQRASDGTTADIGLLSAGGYVNASEQDSFCASTTCTITKVYDQSSNWNDLTVEGAGGAAGADRPASATALPISVDGHEAYGIDFTGQVGYRDNNTQSVATAGDPEGMSMVASGTNVNNQCCFDFGNAETNTHDNGNGHMDAVNFSTTC